MPGSFFFRLLAFSGLDRAMTHPRFASSRHSIRSFLTFPSSSPPPPLPSFFLLFLFALSLPFFFLSTDSSLLSPFVPEAIEASSPYSSISVCTGTGIIVGLCFIYGWKRGKTKETKKKDGGKRVDRRDD